MPKRPPPDSVIEARRRFLAEGAVPREKIRLPILRSWQRSAGRGLDMEAKPEIYILPAHELREAQERHEGLIRAARGELEVLFRDASVTDAIVILTDPQGVVLYCLGKGKFARNAANVALRAGAKWDEEAAGTNAIGTALAEQHPISVLGSEHFFDAHKILSCSAVPIFDPYGAPAGVLDLTNASDISQVHALALVSRAVQAIEHRLFQERFLGHEQMQFHSDPYLIGSSHEGLLAFAGSPAHRCQSHRHPPFGARLEGLQCTSFRRPIHGWAGRRKPQSVVGRLRPSNQKGHDALRAHAGPRPASSGLVACGRALFRNSWRAGGDARHARYAA